MRIVVDTNVIASALFFGGKPYQLLNILEIPAGESGEIPALCPQL